MEGEQKYDYAHFLHNKLIHSKRKLLVGIFKFFFFKKRSIHSSWDDICNWLILLFTVFEFKCSILI
jgi:hypothetical protein